MRESKAGVSNPLPTFDEELSLISQGYSLVAGLDEAGRGPLAGPVSAGVAILPTELTGDWVELIRDSKQLSPSQREYVLPYLQEAALSLEVGFSSAAEIDEIGIVSATRLAMTRALNSLPLTPHYLLLDAIALPESDLPQKSIIRGDSTCRSIAAASIAAKVARDRVMQDAELEYPGYGFGRHKGYGTKEHMQNLRRLGPCPLHRRSFAPVRDWQISK